MVQENSNKERMKWDHFVDNLNIEVVVNVLFYFQGSALCGSDVVASGS